MDSQNYDWRERGLTLRGLIQANAERPGELYKWLCVNGEYRFIRVTYGETHAMLLNAGESASDGGNIAVAKDFWKMMSYGSQTAKCGCSGEAETGLAEALLEHGLKQRDRYE